MGSRWLWSALLGAAGAAGVACLELDEVEPTSGTGGASAGGVGGAAGWPASGGSAGVVVGPGGSAGGGNGGASGFAVQGVAFDGVLDWLELVTPFQGVADTKTVTGSLWFRRVALGKTQCIGPEAAGSNAPNQLEFTDTDSFRLVWRKAGGGVACDLLTSAVTDTASWHHVVFSVDLADASRKHMYLDGASSLFTAYWADTLLDNTGSQWGLFADNGGDSKYQGEVAELWLAMGTYLDLSQASNREKFRSPAGKPVDLGQTGEAPTGVAPTIYLSSRPGGSPNQFAQNRGSGGGFAVHGALALAATSPSD